MTSQNTHVLRRALPYAAIVGSMLLGAPAWSQANKQPGPSPTDTINVPTMKDDLAQRSSDIHWPEGFDPMKADLFAHNEINVDASCQRVWDRIIDADQWPKWYPNSENVRIVSNADTHLKADAVFRWTTFGLPLESKIHEFVAGSRIGWYGYAPGTAPTFYHTWYLVPEGNTCHVVMEEVGKGHDAAHLRATDEGLMHRGHNVWLVTLKWMSEIQ